MSIEGKDPLICLSELLTSLKSDLSMLLLIIQDMSAIDSKYKSAFHHLIMINKFEEKGRMRTNIEKKVNSIIYELSSFSKLLEQVSEDKEANILYAREGLFDRCLLLRDSIQRKMGSL
jgi:hypothetical protein